MACFPGASKGVIVWEWVKAKLLAIILFGPELALHNVSPLLTTNLCSTIAFILLSAYAFYLDQFEI